MKVEAVVDTLTDELAEKQVDSLGETLTKMKARRLVEKLADRLSEAEIETLATHGPTLRPGSQSTLWLTG